MFRYFSQKYKCKLPAAHKEQSSVFTQQEKKNTVNMWYFWAKENTWACLKSTFQTGLFADHDSSPDQTTCCHCQTCTYSQAANSNQNCCSCLQGEIDTCRSASIRGYNQRIFSVIQSLRHDSVRRWRGGRRAVTAPQLQQTHWPHSTWCGSPTWQYSSLKTHRQAEEITPNHTWNTCFYDSIYKPVLWASYSIDQKKKKKLTNNHGTMHQHKGGKSGLSVGGCYNPPLIN